MPLWRLMPNSTEDAVAWGSATIVGTARSVSSRLAGTYSGPDPGPEQVSAEDDQAEQHGPADEHRVLGTRDQHRAQLASLSQRVHLARRGREHVRRGVHERARVVHEARDDRERRRERRADEGGDDQRVGLERDVRGERADQRPRTVRGDAAEIVAPHPARSQRHARQQASCRPPRPDVPEQVHEQGTPGEGHEPAARTQDHDEGHEPQHADAHADAVREVVTLQAGEHGARTLRAGIPARASRPRAARGSGRPSAGPGPCGSTAARSPRPARRRPSSGLRRRCRARRRS